MLLKLLYFLLVGWWFGGLVAIAAYLLCISIIGLPFGVILFNRLPSFIYLTETYDEWNPVPPGRVEELPFIVRVIWFFVIGWELGMAALVFGYLICLTIIGIPLGIFILNRMPLLLTLSQRYRP